MTLRGYETDVKVTQFHKRFPSIEVIKQLQRTISFAIIS